VLRFVEIALGESGSSRCRRCHGAVTETLRDAAEIVADVTRVAQLWPKGPGPNVAFTGVEPFHHPGLRSIVEAAAQAGAERIRLDSDAIALGSPDTARASIEDGVRHLQFGLLGSVAVLHDALAGGARAFDGTIRGATAFSEVASGLGVRVQVSARVPVCRHNLQDLPAIVTTAAKAGASVVKLVVEDERLELATAAPWVEAACDTGIVHATWVEVEGMPFGPAAGWELHLASIYHRVGGEKTALCATCPLDTVCGGATPGAGSNVTSIFAPPVEAARMAACINRSLNPLVGNHNG
jgi:hypothetical protein